jgi:acyl-CoA reductase-like NAD-dependent aldehyde dehydrogenase
MFRWYAESVDKHYDEVAPTGPEALALITRVPLGVVGAIVPWNFPLYLATYALAPALAVGNSVVLKPAEQSPLTAIRLAELAAEAGLPDGVLNVLPAVGIAAGRAIGQHMDVDCVSFTGSTRVGKQFLKYAGESNAKRVNLELGGKSPNIVLADAPNLEAAANAAAWGVFYAQGQVCSAGSRLLLHAPIKEQFLQNLITVVKAMRLGNPIDPCTQLGAVISQDHLDHVLAYIGSGKRAGATLILGGGRVLESSGGYFLEPTIFTGVDNAMEIAQQEIFGPVLSVITFDHLEEAIQIANDSMYGLGAAIWTSDINAALKGARALRAGSVWVNNYDDSDLTVPWGGFKASGNGRAKSLHALEEYSALKSTWIRLS